MPALPPARAGLRTRSAAGPRHHRPGPSGPSGQSGPSGPAGTVVRPATPPGRPVDRPGRRRTGRPGHDRHGAGTGTGRPDSGPPPLGTRTGSPRHRSGGPDSRTARLRTRVLSRLSRADREVLWLYLLTRTGLWVTAYCARWLFPSDGDTREPGSVLAPFAQWDWAHYLQVARNGYFPEGTEPFHSGEDNRVAFFPGFPLLLRAVHAVVPHWTAAGLLISFVAGAVAVLALGRVARLYLPDVRAGSHAVTFLLVSPCAIFLAAGYTEALFLALALPAWLAAHRCNWPLAGLLAALANSVRVSGLFLAAAMVLHFVLSARRCGHARHWPWLAVPAVPPLLYSWYLQVLTGDWMAWKHAQERGWYRTFHTPWDTWANTWDAAFGASRPTGYAFMFQAELVAALVGLLLLALLIRRRQWPEAAYIGLTLWALGTSYWYTSLPRSTLLWWPLWIVLASWSLRTPWVRTAYLCLAAPLTTVFALTFLTGRWTG
ncbi:mannosyltransferase family protein [Streptomyces sp. NPDC047108]|uniref:mannosyltransferase family protein n=1 Tax=Streptomyces sp. NPDC047108 TaxID=3155025 RepID=UPI0033EECEE9